ncbi:MAG: hypothetical protein AAF670_09920 [Planctomycetota bacterium]
MKFSIRVSLLVTFLAAVTFAGTAAARYGYVSYLTWSLGTLVLTTSLACPLVCRASTKPFWAAYSATTAYALISRSTESDPFGLALNSIAALLFGNIDLSHGGYLPRFFAMTVMLWTPAIFGLLSGCLMVVAMKLRTLSITSENQ